MEPYAVFVGLLGVGVVALAYGLFTCGKLSSNDWRYPVLNIVGTSGILYSLAYSWNLPSAVMQVVWIALSLIGLVRILRKGNGHG